MPDAEVLVCCCLFTADSSLLFLFSFTCNVCLLFGFCFALFGIEAFCCWCNSMLCSGATLLNDTVADLMFFELLSFENIVVGRDFVIFLIVIPSSQASLRHICSAQLRGAETRYFRYLGLLICFEVNFLRCRCFVSTFVNSRR